MDYICEICNKQFPKIDRQGNKVLQKMVLKNNTQLKLGFEVILITPRMCYECYHDIKEKLVSIFPRQKIRKVS